MNSYNALINNLEDLELNRIREHLDSYIDMVTEGSKALIDALYELSELEMGFRREAVIKGNVKVANFPFLKEINEFDFNLRLTR